MASETDDARPDPACLPSGSALVPQHRSWADVSLANLQHNVRLAQSLMGPGVAVAAVVKANAYGHGAVPVARAAVDAGATALVVANADEGVELRQAGIAAPVIIIGASFAWEAEAIVAHDLAACVSPPSMLEVLAAEACRQQRRVRVHVMADLGMQRAGVTPDDARALFRRLADCEWVELEGIATHFANADAPDPACAREQTAAFARVVADARAAGLEPRLCHLANSAAILRLPESHHNLVRAGILLYGMACDPSLDGAADWRPVLAWRTRVACLRPLAAGTPVGYGHTYASARDTVLATLPVGYHDGYLRAHSNQAEVVLRGQRAPVVGRVSMDYTTVDVGHIPGVALGDVATLIGRDGEACVRAEELAALRDTIPYEITCAIGSRVRRIYHTT